jgi:DsbC/DsbD-like thiol-disulfide interchange protein
MRTTLTLSTLLLAVTATHASPIASDQVSVDLLSESTALVPGATAWLGLRLQHAPHWHTYWINPGDSGLPTKLRWTLPTGFAADAIAWPAPKRFSVGELTNFGYDGDALLPVALHVPTDAKPGTIAHLGVEARWLVCREECIPGRAALVLDVPVAAQPATDSLWRAAFAKARAAQPLEDARPALARDTGSQIEVSLPGVDLGKDTDAFVQQTRVVANARPQISQRRNDAVLSFAKSDYFTSIPAALDLVVVRTGAPALRIHAAFAAPDPPSKSK